MAEQSDLERTEPASARRREQARDEGQVARSRELSSFALLLAAAAALWFMGADLSGHMSGLVRSSLHFDRGAVFDPESMLVHLKLHSLDALFAFLPLLALLVLTGVAASLLVNGWLFTLKPLAPDWGRLNPIQGIARIFSWHGVIEMAKAIAKAVLVGGVGAWVIWSSREEIFALAAQPLGAATTHFARLVGTSFLVIVGCMALIVVIDVPFQLWEQSRRLRMTREEVREEVKETDGDPRVKARIRSQQREMARRRMMAEIPKADVVVTNPTHYAVALRYRGGAMRAPRVVAKGAHLLAARIRVLAQEHRIPVLEAPALARALYRHADIGEEIPAALYAAVAEVLAYVFQLRRHHEFGGVLPQRPELLPVPADLDPGMSA